MQKRTSPKLEKAKKQELANQERHQMRLLEQKNIEQHNQTRQKIIKNAQEKEKLLLAAQHVDS